MSAAISHDFNQLLRHSLGAKPDQRWNAWVNPLGSA